MAHIEVPDYILDKISQVLDQLQLALPKIQPEIDFSAWGYKWQNKTLIPIYNPKIVLLEDLKGIERQKQKILQNTEQIGRAHV